ncbi:PREDICTED: lymphocyte antigen 86 isoform X2 [Gekko japonicus]|uniref:Lymphocyte antigen 86 isoform X2 n=1 Tax=Gekko japonicus TaxID=146911 RepID=A0ABM1JNJ3_GEKJA|nr:PREDICTED: lymphocyte antigen 86 isoform X2 [Gekko japonicus]
MKEESSDTDNLAHMKMLKVPPLIFLLIYSSTGWPTHTICKDNHLEISYRSCDPLQDLAFTLGSCSGLTTKSVNIRAATVLRYNIRELFVTTNIILNGKSIPFFSKQLCEGDHPNFSFCGRKKGAMMIDEYYFCWLLAVILV